MPCAALTCPRPRQARCDSRRRLGLGQWLAIGPVTFHLAPPAHALRPEPRLEVGGLSCSMQAGILKILQQPERSRLADIFVALQMPALDDLENCIEPVRIAALQ